MNSLRSGWLFLVLTFIINSIQCTEFVPVYMWSTKRSSERSPALRKISQDSFRDDMLEQLKNFDFVVAFVEQTLSPEDFNQQDVEGKKVFSNLAKLGSTSKVNYLPYVQNPVKALKHLDASVSEVFIDSIKDNFDLPKTDLLVVNLNDAEDSENRSDMLKRHDDLIASIYKKIEEQGKRVLILYTAYHESWMTSEDVTNSRRARSLLAADAVPADTAADSQGHFYNDGNILAYHTAASYQVKEKNAPIMNFTFTVSSARTSNGTTVNLASANPQIDISLEFSNSTSLGYYELDQIISKVKGQEENLKSGAEMYAPYGFSYHCGDQLFSNQNLSIIIKDFQVQLYEGSPNNTKFDDPYDCVGFTTVPIWSGLFVTIILLLILSFGITMMMDIKTMDRFDDPKGKTITINAE